MTIITILGVTLFAGLGHAGLYVGLCLSWDISRSRLYLGLGHWAKAGLSELTPG